MLFLRCPARGILFSSFGVNRVRAREVNLVHCRKADNAVPQTASSEQGVHRVIPAIGSSTSSGSQATTQLTSSMQRCESSSGIFATGQFCNAQTLQWSSRQILR